MRPNRRPIAAVVGSMCLGLIATACTGRHLVMQPKSEAALGQQQVEPKQQSAAAATTKPDTATKSAVVTSYGKMPLHFEANQGQADESVKFIARGNGYGLFLTPTEAVLTLGQGTEEKNQKAKVLDTQDSGLGTQDFTSSAISPQPSGLAVRFQLVNSNPSPQIIGVDELPGQTNYFLGNDPSQWRKNVPTYAKVKYENVYPGIDLVYYGNQRQLEHDFIVAPSADPNAIKLNVVDQAGQPLPLTVDAAGDLIVRITDEEIRLRKPLVYQEEKGIRKEVAGNYLLQSSDSPASSPQPLVPSLSFQLASYDTSKPLIIDPILVYSTYLGGSGEDVGTGIAVDAVGNAYVTGWTDSADFLSPHPFPGSGDSECGTDDRCDPMPNPNPPPAEIPRADVFVVKLDPTGTLVYATYVGGRGLENGIPGTYPPGGIAIDANGNAYITGVTTSPDFPTPGGFSQTCDCDPTGLGGRAAFVARLDTDGQLTYGTYLGGGTDYGYSIAVNAEGTAVYVVGATLGGIPTTPNALQPNHSHCSLDAFVTRLDPTKPPAEQVVYSTFFGGGGEDIARGIVADEAGNVYIMGETQSPAQTFPFTLPSGGFDLTCGSDGTCDGYVGCNNRNNRSLADLYVAKIDTTKEGEQSLVYFTYIGGKDQDRFIANNGIAIDAGGNAVIIGHTISTDFPRTPGSLQACEPSPTALIVTKLNASGSALLYSGCFGSNNLGFGVTTNGGGHTYVTGVGTTPPTPFCSGGSALVLKINLNGGVDYVTCIDGPSEEDKGFAIALDAAGSIYVAGATESIDYPTENPIPGQGNLKGLVDGFVAKLDPDSDGDGLSDVQEDILGTNPDDPDSDGDGLDDGEEIAIGTTPTSEDTDGDGVMDGTDTCVLFPNLAQTNTDGDDFGDECEADEDKDNDGIKDDSDTCKFVWNPLNQQDDSDNDPSGNPAPDGIPDACDNCPTVPNSDQTDVDKNGRGDVCDGDSDDPASEVDKTIKECRNDKDCDGITDDLEAGLGTQTSNPDSDGDGWSDGTDNCPTKKNPQQTDTDLDGQGDECEDDKDGDRVSDTAPDNCLLVFNPDQKDADKDTDPHLVDENRGGDACDHDADGDTYPTEVFGGPDCDDLDSTVHPGAPEVPLNGKDDDCENGDAPVVSGVPEIALTVTDPKDSSANEENWLPTDGREVIITASLKGETGRLQISQLNPKISLSVRTVSHEIGRYTNDNNPDLCKNGKPLDQLLALCSCEDNPDLCKAAEPCPDYEVLGSEDNKIHIRSRDFGGSGTIHAEVTLILNDETPIIVRKDLTLPKDTDHDGLPDYWENDWQQRFSEVGDLTADGDIDRSDANDEKGDGLTNFEEYRGFIWGPALLRVGPNDEYQTPTYVPKKETSSHFRGAPNRKDLFLKYIGYDAAKPFALGTAFIEDAKIDVHAVDISAILKPGECKPENVFVIPGSGECRIDAVLVCNELLKPYNGTDGHIHKEKGLRFWTWDQKGVSTYGDGATYGVPITYQVSLDAYFNERPYVDGGSRNNRLDPVKSPTVEDQDDNGTISVRGKKSEDINKNGSLDGDYMIPDSISQQLTPFDVDNDGRVELPVIGDPKRIQTQFEYTKNQVLKHTITHEVGHAIGMFHNTDASCLMYDQSPNWNRDVCLSIESKKQIHIHND